MLTNIQDHKELYIFCSFPHGANTIHHFLTMTDCCGMLSTVYQGPRRDLCASILFFIPIVRELLLFLGCVDASSMTAHFNLKKRRSLLIFIGGEKEQLMTSSGENKIYLNSRKGFLKLALEHGAHLVPMYAFGENETYTCVNNLAPQFQKWLQENLQIGFPICYGRWGSLIPNKVELQIEIGKPIKVEKMNKKDIRQEQIDDLHKIFVEEMRRLFDRTKTKHGCADKSLEIY